VCTTENGEEAIIIKNTPLRLYAKKLAYYFRGVKKNAEGN